MTNAAAKLNARIAAMTTAQLLEISLRMALDTSNEAIIVCAKVEGELMRRMPEAEFVAHCGQIEALLDAAA
jgi:hypothetical protein